MSPEVKLPVEFVVTVTNFNFWQKIVPLIAAIKSMAPHLHDRQLEWLILGDGLFFEKFKNHLQEEIHLDWVKPLGHQNPFPYYQKAKALFYFSGMDALPNVILEAFMMKLLVVMNKDCPASEFLQYHNGFLIDTTDPHEIEALLFDIKQGGSKLHEITENAYTYLQQNFSIAAVSGQLEKALRSTIREEH